MALLRPSELARLWALHPNTVNGWIREGRLPAIRTPGAQYRVREADARAYCQEHGLPMPKSVSGPGGSIVLVGRPSPVQRAIVRACKARRADVVALTNALSGLLAIGAGPPDVIAIDGNTEDVKAIELVRALRRSDPTKEIPIIIYDVSTRLPTAKLERVSVVAASDPELAVRAVLDTLDAAQARRRI